MARVNKTGKRYHSYALVKAIADNNAIIRASTCSFTSLARHLHYRPTPKLSRYISDVFVVAGRPIAQDVIAIRLYSSVFLCNDHFQKVGLCQSL